MPRVSAACALLLLATGVATSGAFTNFESGHVRPLAITPDGAWLLAVDTPDARLAVYALTPSGATLAADVPVGLEPVAVAARINAAGRPEAWIVNHLSDSVSIVEIDPVEPARSRVTRTLLVGDEPRDVVFAGDERPARVRHCGAPRPEPARRSAAHHRGRRTRRRLGLRRRRSRARRSAAPRSRSSSSSGHAARPAVSPDGSIVYAAVFQSGNRTTTAARTRASSPNGGLPPPPPGATPGAPDTGLIVQRRSATRWSRRARPRLERPARLLAARPRRLPYRRRCRPAGGDRCSAWAASEPMLFNMAVRPTNGTVFVSNTEARNPVRFEADGSRRPASPKAASPSSTARASTPVHLNPHIRYAVSPGPTSEIDDSVAFPTDMVFSTDGATLYVAALGSGVVAAVDAAALEAGDAITTDAQFPSAAVRAASRSTPTSDRLLRHEPASATASPW